MTNKRKICIVTGTRAEYGLLYWLMKEIEVDPELQLQIIVTGMHLSPEFGLTYRQIEADGLVIDARVEMLLSSDTPVGIAKSMGLGVIGFADALDRLKPDILVLLGDRFEILSAAQAAMVARIPIAHIHGGESTEGVIDEAIRHAVTKMAHLHFTAAEPYRKRVIQLGEAPERVFLTGDMALDNLMRLEWLSRQELECELEFALEPVPIILCTYHPVTLQEDDPANEMRALLCALDRFPEARIIFTKCNADTGGRIINGMMEGYAALHPQNAAVFSNLGQLRYLSLLRIASVVLGNSSSGLIEAPLVQTPTVNVGERQRGRLRASSVIDCAATAEAIVEALERALSPEFHQAAASAKPEDSAGGVSENIAHVLKTIPMDGLLFKKFYDL